MMQIMVKVLIVLITGTIQCCGADFFEPRHRGKGDKLIHQISDGFMVVLRIRKTLIEDKICRAESARKTVLESLDQLSFDGQMLLQINEELVQSCDQLQNRICSDFDRGMLELRDTIQKDWFKE